MSQGICLICGERFERDDKERKSLGCGEYGENTKQMAKSMFLYSTPRNQSFSKQVSEKGESK
jgi:hypothetical protein